MLLLLACSILTLIHPPSGLVIGLVLMGLALLEFVLNICVGCLIYRYVMLPLFTQRKDA